MGSRAFKVLTQSSLPMNVQCFDMDSTLKPRLAIGLIFILDKT